MVKFTSIWKSILAYYKGPLFFMIKNCNLCRSAKIYLVHLFNQEDIRKHSNQTALSKTNGAYLTHFWFKSYSIPLFSKTLPILQVVKIIQCLQSFYPNFTGHIQLSYYIQPKTAYYRFNCMLSRNSCKLARKLLYVLI